MTEAFRVRHLLVAMLVAVATFALVTAVSSTALFGPPASVASANGILDDPNDLDDIDLEDLLDDLDVDDENDVDPVGPVDAGFGGTAGGGSFVPLALTLGLLAAVGAGALGVRRHRATR